MYTTIGGKGSDKKTPHNVCSIIMGMLIVISIILLIIGIVMFLQPPKKITPLHNPRAPAPITYSGNPVVCDNINLISIKSYADIPNRTVYSIKSTPGMEYNNVITLASGKPLVGFYNCTKNKQCLTYSFKTKEEPCSDKQQVKDNLNPSTNCIGGKGCHFYNWFSGTVSSADNLVKYPIPPESPND